MWFIGTSHGFVEAIRVIKNKTQIDFTPDVRKALSFATFREGEREMYKASCALPLKSSYFALITDTAQAMAEVPLAA